jgi:hypothetical protein
VVERIGVLHMLVRKLFGIESAENCVGWGRGVNNTESAMQPSQVLYISKRGRAKTEGKPKINAFLRTISYPIRA